MSLELSLKIWVPLQFTNCTVEYHCLFEDCKVFEYQTEADILKKPWTYDKGAKDRELNDVLWL